MFRQELEVNSLKSTPRQIQVGFEFAYIFEFFAQVSLVSRLAHFLVGFEFAYILHFVGINSLGIFT